MSDIVFGDPRLPERFWSKVRVAESGCWEWTATRSTRGYGRYSIDARPFQAHRVAYEALLGPIPSGLFTDHLCRVRHCVNPAHLEPVTNRENVLRGESHVARLAQRDHCSSGHAYTAESSYLYRGARRCRPCKIAEHRKARRKLATPGDGQEGSKP